MFWRTHTSTDLIGAVHRAAGLARAFMLLEDNLEPAAPADVRARHPHHPELRPRKRVRRPGAVLSRPQHCISPVAHRRACGRARTADAGRR